MIDIQSFLWVLGSDEYAETSSSRRDIPHAADLTKRAALSDT
jgi:hypothetical protein